MSKRGIRSEVRVRYSAIKDEYLVEFFEDGEMYAWDIAGNVNELTGLIRKFYHDSPHT